MSEEMPTLTHQEEMNVIASLTDSEIQNITFRNIEENRDMYVRDSLKLTEKIHDLEYKIRIENKFPGKKAVSNIKRWIKKIKELKENRQFYTDKINQCNAYEKRYFGN